MHRRQIRVLAGISALAVVLTLSGCAEDRPPKDEVVDALVEGGLDEGAATCAVNGFYDDVSAAGLDEVVRGAEDLDDPDDAAAFTEAFRSCTAVATGP